MAQSLVIELCMGKAGQFTDGSALFSLMSHTKELAWICTKNEAQPKS